MHRISFSAALKRALLPAIRFAVRRALPIQDCIELIKQLYVEETSRQMAKAYPPNISQIAVATGMHRRDVVRLMESPTSERKDFEDGTNLLMKVLGTWGHDKRFVQKGGGPRPLQFRGKGNEFHQLVAGLSRDVSPKSVRTELKRLQLIEEQDGMLILIKNPELYLLGDVEGFSQLAADLDTAGCAAYENLYDRQDPPNLHARTAYDNIFEDSLPTIRKWFVDLGTEIHQRTRTFLSEHDKDISPTPHRKAGASVEFCTFSLSRPRTEDS